MGSLSANFNVAGILGYGFRSVSDENSNLYVNRNIARGKINGKELVGGICSGISLNQYDGTKYCKIVNNVCAVDTLSSVNDIPYRISHVELPNNYAYSKTLVLSDSAIVEVEDNNNNGSSYGANTLKRKTTYQGMEFDFENQWDIVNGSSFPYNIKQSAPPTITSCVSGEFGKISGTSVEDGKIYVFVGNKMFEGVALDGKWEVELGKIEEGTTVRVSVDSDTKMGSILVSSKAENKIVILDEDSEIIPEKSNGAVDIKVKRNIKSNEWTTICLPFAMTESQVYAVFGDDVNLCEFMEYEISEDQTEITVFVDNAILSEDGFMSNYPYLIRTSNDITEFLVTSTIEPDETNAIAEFTNGRTGSRKEVYGTFFGTLKSGNNVPANCLFIENGKFYYSNENIIKAFHGYFDFVDVIKNYEDAETKIKINYAGDVTGIDEIVDSSKSENNLTYDLLGRCVLNPTRGLYIKNGKKFLIK